MIPNYCFLNLLENKDLSFYIDLVIAMIALLIMLRIKYSKSPIFIKLLIKNFLNSNFQTEHSTFIKNKKMNTLRMGFLICSVIVIVLFLDNIIILFPFRDSTFIFLFLEVIFIILSIRSLIIRNYSERNSTKIFMLFYYLSHLFLELHFYFFPFRKILYFVILFFTYFLILFLKIKYFPF